MRLETLAFALVATIVVWTAPAPAQDGAQSAVARELERKARSGEADRGFCTRAGARLDRLDRPAAAVRLNQLLSRNDAAPAALLFVISDAPSGEPVCALLAFRPAAMREGLKCRVSHVFVCIHNSECRARLDDVICEVKPGQWD